MRQMRPVRGRSRARGEAVAGIDEPVAIVGMGAQGDGEQALAARRAAMGARRELLKIFTPFDQNLTQI